MPQAEPRAPAWWILMDIGLILMSAVVILYPHISPSGMFYIPFGLFLPIYFVVLIRREKAAHRINVPLKQLYNKVKRGRRLLTSPLEIAATVALVLALIRMS